MFKWPILPGFIWAFFIVLLTLTPGNYITRVTPFPDWIGLDKLIHLFLFGIYTYLLLEGFRRQRKYPFLLKNTVILSLLLGMVFALFTEIMQNIIPGRNGNYYDFLADMLGCLLGYLCWYIIRRNEKKNLHSSKNYN